MSSSLKLTLAQVNRIRKGQAVYCAADYNNGTRGTIDVIVKHFFFSIIASVIQTKGTTNVLYYFNLTVTLHRNIIHAVISL